jgi:hypothetical protein
MSAKPAAATRLRLSVHFVVWCVLLPAVLLLACGGRDVQLVVNVLDSQSRRPLPGSSVSVHERVGILFKTTRADASGNAYLWVPADRDLILTVGAADAVHTVHQDEIRLHNNPEHVTVILGVP